MKEMQYSPFQQNQEPYGTSKTSRVSWAFVIKTLQIETWPETRVLPGGCLSLDWYTTCKQTFYSTHTRSSSKSQPVFFPHVIWIYYFEGKSDKLKKKPVTHNPLAISQWPVYKGSTLEKLFYSCMYLQPFWTAFHHITVIKRQFSSTI